MKKTSIILTMLFLVLSFSLIVSAADKKDIIINGTHTHNDSIVSSINGHTTAINKSIEKVESSRYIDVKLSLKSIEKIAPKTGDMNNMIPFTLMLIVGGGIIALFRKKASKAILSLVLIVTLLPVLSLTTIVVHAEPKGLTFVTTETFSDETLASFSFDKIISSSAGSNDLITDNSGKTTGIKWNLDKANSEQSLVYRLLLNDNVPDDLIDKEINVSSAHLDFIDRQGKTTNTTYPNVSVKLTESAIPTPPTPPTPMINLTYNANGGNGDDIVLNLAEGSTKTVEENTFTNADHTFLHWNTAPDGSGTSYSPGDTITITNDITLYAQWQAISPESFTVNYDANSGTGGHTDTNNISGSLYTIKDASDIGINKTDNNFVIWNTVPDGSGTSYSPGDTIPVTGDITLYAQWNYIFTPLD